MENLKEPTTEVRSKHHILLGEESKLKKNDRLHRTPTEGLRDARGLDIAHVSSRSNAEIDHEDGTPMSQNNDNELENMESHSQQHQLSDEEEQGNARLNSDPQNLPSHRTGSKNKIHGTEDSTFLTRPDYEEPINIKRFNLKFDTSKLTLKQPLAEIGKILMGSFGSAHEHLKESYLTMKTKLNEAASEYNENVAKSGVEQDKNNIQQEEQQQPEQQQQDDEVSVVEKSVNLPENDSEDIQEKSELYAEKAQNPNETMLNQSVIQDHSMIHEHNATLNKSGEVSRAEHNSDDANILEKDHEPEEEESKIEEKDNAHEHDESAADSNFEKKETSEVASGNTDGIDISTQRQPGKEIYHLTHAGVHSEESLSPQKQELEIYEKMGSHNQSSSGINPLNSNKISPRSQENPAQEDEKERIRQQLLAAQQEKDELEGKLKGVERKIYELKHQKAVSNRTSPQGARKSPPSKEEEILLKRKAESLVRRMNWERQQKELREEQKRRKLELRLEQELELLQNRRIYIEEREFRLAVERRRRIDEKKLEKSREEPNYSHFQSSEERSLPLFQQLEKRYEKEILLPEIEHRKQILAARKEAFKPLDHQMFHLFEEKYKEAKIKAEMRRKIFQEQLRMNAPPVKTYQSKTAKLLVEIENQQKLEELKKQQEKKARYDTRAQYSKAVRDMFQPKHTLEKELLLKQNTKEVLEKAGNLRSFENTWKEKERQITIKYKVTSDVKRRLAFSSEKYRSKSPDFVDLKSKIAAMKNSGDGTQSLENHLEHRSERENWSEKKQQPSKPIFYSVKSTQKKGSINDETDGQLKSDRSRITDNDLIKKRNHSTYTQRLNRDQGNPGDVTIVRAKRIQPWDRYIKDENLTLSERVSYVLNDTKILEDKAKKKLERLVRRSADVSLIKANEEENEIDELYLNTIKAKLAALEKMNEENKNQKSKQVL